MTRGVGRSGGGTWGPDGARVPCSRPSRQVARRPAVDARPRYGSAHPLAVSLLPVREGYAR